MTFEEWYEENMVGEHVSEGVARKIWNAAIREFAEGTLNKSRWDYDVNHQIVTFDVIHDTLKELEAE